ncbi:MAG: hypothetical protein NT166_25235 [Candidatus Aminicenantes bacterium]|nr:hypothetical protein [Candidatus Aminicenantes bacterium]
MKPKLVFVLCCFMATGVWAAQKVDLLSANSTGYIRKMNNQGDHGRYQQTYKGIPVWGHEVFVSRDV